MMLRKKAAALVSALALLVLILDSKTALSGAAAGLSLCLKTVIPSLFPFLFLCRILMQSLWGSTFPAAASVCRTLGIPAGGESLLIPALLGGYPVGAQAVADAFQEGRLTRQEAEHLLTFCSNAGPAFLFGMAGILFSGQTSLWALWCIQMLSSFLVGLWGKKPVQIRTIIPARSLNLTEILKQTLKTMALICGWILLMRILIQFLQRWFFWYFPAPLQIILTGILELSNGCCDLSLIPTESARFLICSGFLSFGGICVLLQTASVLGELSLIPYLLGKIIQTMVSLMLSAGYLLWGWAALIPAAGLLIFIPSLKKDVDFPEPSLYNTVINGGRNQNNAVS